MFTDNKARTAELMGLVAIIIGATGMLLNKDSMALFGIVCAIYAHTMVVTEKGK